MEELGVALKGNKCANQRRVSHDSMSFSVDSLDVDINKAGKRCAASNNTLSQNDSCSDDCKIKEEPYSSTTSVKSEPSPKAKMKLGFIQSAMEDYLNSHRHSISSVLELINPHERYHIEADSYGSSDFFEQNSEPLRESEFNILSPIEENSEPSTRSSSFRGSGSSGRRRPICQETLDRAFLSISCDALLSDRMNCVGVNQEYGTFPRSKSLHDSSEALNREGTIFPLEPREIDPCGYHQLHTADSQEELQEFLLLESECMHDNAGRGLASAFTLADADSSRAHENN